MIIEPSWNEEQSLWNRDYKYVCGVDEVGRGSWAGPVVVAAVIFSERITIDFPIRDSKTLSLKQREALFPQIQKSSYSFAFGMVDASEVDISGIVPATFKAMRQAIENLHISPDFCLVDGRQKIHRYDETEQKAIVKGDQKSYTIAAASVLAKVHRDRMMKKHHDEFDHYGFDTNVGYGTKKHQEGIRQKGLCRLHRKTFVPKKLLAS